MSVIIRLQNLPWSANALDIRQYFQGLSIPEGGVHIVGGELGDAFIAFSTDEDARQAFTRNNGKIKEIQISLMLSSRTEMQRVIEGARAQSYAAFMQATPSAVPLPAVVPPIVPAAVPEVKKEPKDKGDKRDRRRSRSKSREKKDRSRDHDRKDKRHRDRSRSRSRDRKNRNRRDRSRSRGRSRSRERDRKNRDRRRRSDERSNSSFRDVRKPASESWSNQNKSTEMGASGPQPPSLLTGNIAAAVIDQAKRSLNDLPTGPQGQPNGFPLNNFNNGGRNNSRDSWPPSNPNFINNRNDDNFPINQDQPPFPNRFQRNNFPPRGGNRIEHDFKDCCISVEPFYGGYGDIRRFFQGMFISNKGIKFINDCNGRRTGIVYVQLGNTKNMEEALCLDGEILNGINVSVTRIDDQEFEEAVDRYLPTMNNDDNSNDGSFKFKSRNQTKYFNNSTVDEPDWKDYSCLIVEDLPTYCKEQDILHMFSQHPLVALILTMKKRGGYIAYVKFGSKEMAKKAFDEKSHHIVGGKPVTVRPCKDDEFNEINKQHDVNLNSPKTEDIKTDCVHLSKLPPKTTDKDIADFFSDIGVIPTKIHLSCNNHEFTGEAYCEFVNTEEAARALKKNDTALGKTVVAVVPCSREDMLNVLDTGISNPKMMESRLPPKPMPPLHMGPNPMRMHNPNRPPFFNRTFDNGPPRGPMRFGPRGPPRHRFPPPDMVDEVPPGCTVYMKNVPYKAGTNEILQLFEGYSHTRNVSRRYNSNNTPSDEAKITFFDADEATRAVEELNQAQIWDRPIFLRQD